MMSLSSQLSELESSGLILLTRLEPDIEYLFRHALVQEAAYHSLVKVDRRMLHRAVGEALERLNTEAAESPDLAPMLARHFAEAGDSASALRYYTVAAHAAMQVYANAEAIQHFDRAIEMARIAGADIQVITDLYLRRGRALELNAQDAVAIENYKALEAWAVSVGSRPAQLAALAARATIYVKPSVEQNLTAGYEISQQALALARELGDRAAEAKVLWNLLQYYMVGSDIAKSVEVGEQALAIAREEDLSEQVAYVLTDLLKVYSQTDRPERATAALEEARGIWRELGILNMLADNLSTTAMLHVTMGRFDESLEVAEEARQISFAIGNLWNQAYSYYIVDLPRFERGDVGEAIEIASTCMRLSEQAGFAEGITQSSINLALMYAYMGAPEMAQQYVQRELARAEASTGTAYSGPLLEAIIAQLHLSNGQPAEARADLDRANQDLEALKNTYFLTYYFFAVVEAELALAAGDHQRAFALAGDMLQFLRRGGIRLVMPDVLYLQGRALRVAGQTDRGEQALHEARAEAEDMMSRRTLWLILAELADIEAGRGNDEAAQNLRAQAVQAIDYIADHAGSDELRQSFLHRPDVRALLRQAGRAA